MSEIYIGRNYVLKTEYSLEENVGQVLVETKNGKCRAVLPVACLDLYWGIDERGPEDLIKSRRGVDYLSRRIIEIAKVIPQEEIAYGYGDIMDVG